MTRLPAEHVAKLCLRMQGSRRLLVARHAHDLHTSLSLTDNLHKNSLTTTSVELAIENLLPRAEVEFPACDRHDDFSPHHLSLQMGISIIFPCIVMPVHRPLRSEPFQEIIVVLQQTGLIVIDVDTGRDVHRVYQDEAFLYPALFDHCFDVGRDIDVGPPGLCLKPEFFAV